MRAVHQLVLQFGRPGPELLVSPRGLAGKLSTYPLVLVTGPECCAAAPRPLLGWWPAGLSGVSSILQSALSASDTTSPRP